MAKKPEPVNPVKPTTAITKPAEREVNTEVLDFAADAGRGLEGADKASFAIPFLIVLQSNSPQLKTMKEARQGMFMNSITNELYESVQVIPCAYQRRFIRWCPRSAGGGYKGELSPIDVETGKVPGLSTVQGQYLMDVPPGATPFDKDGKHLFDHLADTRGHFILMQSVSGAWQPALLALSSTQIKKSKRWMSRIQGLELKDSKGKTFNPPSFSHTYQLTTIEEKNAKGEWWGIVIDIVGPVQDAGLYAAARRFHESVVSGAVEVAPPADHEDIEPSNSSRF